MLLLTGFIEENLGAQLDKVLRKLAEDLGEDARDEVLKELWRRAAELAPDVVGELTGYGAIARLFMAARKAYVGTRIDTSPAGTDALMNLKQAIDAETEKLEDLTSAIHRYARAMGGAP